MRKKMALVLIAGFVLSWCGLGLAGTPILKLDINQTNTPAETEEGFISFTIADSGSQVDGITVELGGTLDSRRRGTPTGVPFEQVYRDFIFSRPGAMTVTLSGLAANTTYEITIYAWDTSSTETRVADWTANGIPVCQTVFDGSQNPPTAEDDYAFTGRATADSSGTIFLESAPGEGTREVSGAAHPFAFLNALVISSSPPITEARGPDPADGALLEDTRADLSWVQGDLAVLHDVYFGDSFDEVAAATPDDADVYAGKLAIELLSVGVAGGPYPEGLVPGTTYYWRVDEVNDLDPNSPWKGDVWSLRVQPAWNPSPADGVPYVLPEQDLSWNAGMNALFHTVYVGEDFNEVKDATTGGMMLAEATYDPGAFNTDTTYYWRVDEFAGTGTVTGDVWSFTTVPEVAVADPTLVVWWTLDEGEGTTAVDWSGHGNHGALEGGPQWVDGYAFGALEFDGVDDVGEVPLQPSITFEQGDSFSVLVWINTAVTPNPNDGIVGNYRITTTPYWMLLINGDGTANFNARDVGSAHSTSTASPNRIDDSTWHHLAGIRDQQAKKLRLYVDGDLVDELDDATEDINSGQSIWIGDHLNRYYEGLIDDARIYDRALTQDEVQQIMRGDPTLAWNPEPTRGAVVDVRDAAFLSWSAGDAAASHNVYLGTERDATAAAGTDSAEYQGNQPGTSLSLAGLVEFGGGDYYWRIDEVQADGALVAGNIWKFTVPAYLVVEDFESYTNEVPGNPGNGTGAAVGHDIWSVDSPYLDGTIMETANVHGGNQAMPVYYDNTVAPAISEADCTLTPGQNWTAEGVTTLVVYFRGQADNTGTLYVKINGVQVPYDGDIAGSDWVPWEIDLASVGVSLTNVTSLTIGIEGGQAGVLFIDDIQLTKP